MRVFVLEILTSPLRMTHYKLNYFEFRGRGELIRFIFHAAGQEFDDHRIKHDDWSSLKSMSPNGQLPLLEITDNGKTIRMIQSMAIGNERSNSATCSKFKETPNRSKRSRIIQPGWSGLIRLGSAIRCICITSTVFSLAAENFKSLSFLLQARYLARKFGLVGTNDLEAGICDSFAEQLHDMLNEFGKCHFEPDEQRKKQMTEKFHNELIPNSLKIFEHQLESNNGHFSGNQLTYADVSLCTPRCEASLPVSIHLTCFSIFSALLGRCSGLYGREEGLVSRALSSRQEVLRGR